MLFLAIYPENKPRAGYANGLGRGKIKFKKMKIHLSVSYIGNALTEG